MTDYQFNQFSLEAFITEREGMIAENASRERRGEAPAYSGDDFMVLANRIMKFRNER
jgi:hypothetical protein